MGISWLGRLGPLPCEAAGQTSKCRFGPLSAPNWLTRNAPHHNAVIDLSDEQKHTPATPLRIDANALYTRASLAALLDGTGVDVDTFTKRIAARKVFRMLWLGSDLLEAYRKAPELSDKPEAPPQPKGRKPRKASAPLSVTGKIDDYLQQLKIGKQ